MCNCNNCDECNTCSECCNPNIVGADCITVDTSEEWVITIWWGCPTQITSEDGSITVTEWTPDDGYSVKYNIEVTNEDQYVKACSGDTTPWTLNEKLQVSSPLTLATVWCSGSDSYLRLGLDTSKIDYDNNKVAVNSWCSAKYLSDALKCEAEDLELVSSWCSMVLRDKNKSYACGKIVLQESIKGSVPWDQVGWFVLAESWLVGAPSAATKLWASYSLSDLSHNMHYEGWALVCEKAWVYQVGFNSAFEAWFWVHWMRMLLHHCKSSSSYETVVESRYSWPVGLTPYEMWMSNIQEYNTMYIAKRTEVDGVQWKSASLGWVLDRMNCWGSTIIEMEEWDMLMLWVVVQASTSYDWEYLNWDSSEWHFAVIGMSGSQAWVGLWAQIYAYLLQPL